MKITKILTQLLLGALLFAAGYLTSNLRNAELFESIRYTTLLTQTRWSLFVLDSLDANEIAKIRTSLGSLLRSDQAELESFRQLGTLGAEGEDLFKRTNAKLSNSTTAN